MHCSPYSNELQSPELQLESERHTKDPHDTAKTQGSQINIFLKEETNTNFLNKG